MAQKVEIDKHKNTFIPYIKISFDFDFPNPTPISTVFVQTVKQQDKGHFPMWKNPLGSYSHGKKDKDPYNISTMEMGPI